MESRIDYRAVGREQLLFEQGLKERGRNRKIFVHIFSGIVELVVQYARHADHQRAGAVRDFPPRRGDVLTGAPQDVSRIQEIVADVAAQHRGGGVQHGGAGLQAARAAENAARSRVEPDFVFLFHGCKYITLSGIGKSDKRNCKSNIYFPGPVCYNMTKSPAFRPPGSGARVEKAPAL